MSFATHPSGVRITARELQVLELAADGLSSREIADALGLSWSTVKSHIGALMWIFGVEDRVQAVREARRLGVLPTKRTTGVVL